MVRIIHDHRKEAIACSVIQTEDAWWNETDGSGGYLVLDIDLFSWDQQPTRLLIESTLTDGVTEFLYEDTASPVSENVSTWHVEVPAKPLHSDSGHEYWVIAESGDYDYKNDLPGIPSAEGPLAAFFRFPATVGDLPPCGDPKVQTMTCGEEDPGLAEARYYPSCIGYGGPFNDPIYVEVRNHNGDPLDVLIPTSLTLIDNHTFECDLDFAGKEIGDFYDVYVYDGCGTEWLSEFKIQIYDPFKNIPIPLPVPWADANDIAVDHSNGNLLILFSNGDVYRFLESEQYMVAQYFCSTLEGCDKIDVSPDGNVVVGGEIGGSITYAASYNSVGNLASVHSLPGSSNGVKEVIGSTMFAYPNHHGVVAFSEPNSVWLGSFAPPSYVLVDSGTTTSQPGIGNLQYEAIVGCEASADAYQVVFLESAPENKAQIFSMNLVYTGIIFDSFGGNQFHLPLDITRDDNNKYFVLDLRTDGSTSIHRFKYNGQNNGKVDNINEFTISGTPLRIEGSDYNGNVFVLHSNGISIFRESEL